MSLDTYQRSVATALHPDAAPTDRATEIIRDAVRRWARLQLRSLCPLTTSLLELDQRFDAEVHRALATGRRPVSIHRWSQTFLEHLDNDAEPLVAELARFELSCIAPALVAAKYPDGWPSSFEPELLVRDLVGGRDPRHRTPRSARLHLQRNGDGWSLEQRDT